MQRFVWIASGIVTSLVFWWLHGFAWGLVAALAFIAAFEFTELKRISQWVRHPSRLPAPAEGWHWRQNAMRVHKTIGEARGRARAFVSILRQMQRTADAIPDGLVVVRGSGEIEYFNKAAGKLLGLLPGDRGENLFALIRDPEVQTLYASESAGLLEIDSPVDSAVRIEMRRVELEEARYIIIARDVTALNRLLTLRRDFVANVSHELRTPLTVILGYLESLTEDKLGKAQRKAAITKLARPARRIQALAEDLLTLTNLESSPHPDGSNVVGVVVDRVLVSVVEEAHNLSQGKHEILLESDASLVVEGIADELFSAFHNLVINAVRYSPDGGKIWVRWYRGEEGAVFEVEDEGMGIAAEHLSRLTERFYRVDLRGARVRGGTGLGLAIVKHVLRRHGSVLNVESTLGKGSRFWCVLPPLDMARSA